MFKLTLKHKKWLWAYAFLLIPMAFFLYVRLYPTISSFRISLFDWNPLSPEHPFVGIDNYKAVWEQLG